MFPLREYILCKNMESGKQPAYGCAWLFFQYLDVANTLILLLIPRGRSGIWHIYHEWNSYPAEGDMSFSDVSRPCIWLSPGTGFHNFRHGSKKSYTVSGIQNGWHIPLPWEGYMGSYTPSNHGFWFAENLGHGINYYMCFADRVNWVKRNSAFQ